MGDPISTAIIAGLGAAGTAIGTGATAAGTGIMDTLGSMGTAIGGAATDMGSMFSSAGLGAAELQNLGEMGVKIASPGAEDIGSAVGHGMLRAFIPQELHKALGIQPAGTFQQNPIGTTSEMMFRLMGMGNATQQSQQQKPQQQQQMPPFLMSNMQQDPGIQQMMMQMLLNQNRGM